MATYYVSKAGNNTTGTGTKDKPWLTHPWMRPTAGNPAYTPTAGDTFVLRCGDEWYAEIRALQSGSSGSPIILTADSTWYTGSGDMPIISSTYDPTTLPPWTNTSGTIYSSAGATAAPRIVAYHPTSGTNRVLNENTATPTTPGADEWGYDTLTLYVNVGEDPTTGSVYASYEYGYSVTITTNAQTDVIFSYITSQCGHTNATGNFYLNGARNVVDHCISRWSKVTGVYIDVASATVTNNEIYNTYGYKGLGDTSLAGIRQPNASGTITGNYIHGVGYGYYGDGATPGGSGIWLRTAAATNNVLRNRVENCYLGILMTTISSGADANVIAYNRLKNCTVNCIDIQDDNNTDYNYVYNNTIYHTPSALNTPAYTGHGISLQVTGVRAKVANNLVIVAPGTATTAAHGIYYTGYTSIYADNNLVHIPVSGNGVWGRLGLTTYATYALWKAAVQADAAIFDMAGTANKADEHSLGSDPLLVSATDFHLQVGSPAINAGTDVLLTTDYDGRPIAGLPDIGAYERRAKFFW
jgi:hypothetical protein